MVQQQYFQTAEAHLNIVTVKIKLVVLVIENLGRIIVPRITGHIVRQHKYDPLVRYS